jgi:SAM-dependent methyltransferase
MDVVDIVPSEIGRNSLLQRKALAAAGNGVFLGGPPKAFHAVGCDQLITLLECGLVPEDHVLDVGCGCLRGGFWLMHFLDPDRYCGIEPNRAMLSLGLEQFVPAETVTAKRPRFDHTSSFDFGVFGRQFDFVIARSVWTHAAPRQIETMLDQFVAWSTPGASFVTSYLKADSPDQHYVGESWVGRDHIFGTPGMVRYTPDWIVSICHKRGLRVRELRRRVNSQIWLWIDRAA